jgi:hypothetical protein
MIDKGNNDYVLQKRRLAEPTKFSDLDKNRNAVKDIREIDIDPPEIFGKNQSCMRRILADKLQTDSSHHDNGEIKW